MTMRSISTGLLALAFATGPGLAMQHEGGGQDAAQALPAACGAAVAGGDAPAAGSGGGTMSDGGGHGGHAASPDADASPAWPALMGAMQDMETTMPHASSGDSDEDFVRMMIPHHQSAVDMAEAVLAENGDPAIRGLAEAVIASQAQEIATMCGWLEQRG